MAKCVCVWDFTIKSDLVTDSKELMTILRPLCKKFAFQLEKGADTGYLHYQCRISLYKKKRKTELLALLAPTKIATAHISPTCLPNADKYEMSGDAFYIMKADTRIDGPWTDKDYREPIKLTSYVSWVKEWLPWQQTIMDDVKAYKTRDLSKPAPRYVNVVIDPTGCQGKSVLAAYMDQMQLCGMIPSMSQYEDIMHFVQNRPKYGGYMMDLPRAMRKDKLYQMWAALETVKMGYAYDKRYAAKAEWFEPPCIWVFTNMVPDLTMLSPDRWRLWAIADDNTLAHYVYPHLAPSERLASEPGRSPSRQKKKRQRV